jgi:YVTN family beta-propeller protein
MFCFGRTKLNDMLRALKLILGVFLIPSALYADWETANVDVGNEPNAVCVNPSTNKIYVSNYESDNVTVIDGKDNSTTTVSAGESPEAICLNSNTNKIYVANSGFDSITVIDGISNSTTTIAAGEEPYAISVNPSTNRIYVANQNSNDVTVIDEVIEYASPPRSYITRFSDDETTARVPLFTGYATNWRSPTNCNIMKILYQLETTQGEWREATITSGGGTYLVNWEAAATNLLTIGFHSLYVFALDSTAGTINMTENFTGSITPYYFLVREPETGIEMIPENLNELILSCSNLFVNPAIIAYHIPGETGKQKVSLNVYNIYGSLIKELVNGERLPGSYVTNWDGTDSKGARVPNGVYFYLLKTEIGEISRKSIVVR